jgi:hypothetical protein
MNTTEHQQWRSDIRERIQKKKTGFATARNKVYPNGAETIFCQYSSCQQTHHLSSPVIQSHPWNLPRVSLCQLKPSHLTYLRRVTPTYQTNQWTVRAFGLWIHRNGQFGRHVAHSNADDRTGTTHGQTLQSHAQSLFYACSFRANFLFNAPPPSSNIHHF